MTIRGPENYAWKLANIIWPFYVGQWTSDRVLHIKFHKGSYVVGSESNDALHALQSTSAEKKARETSVSPSTPVPVSNSTEDVFLLRVSVKCLYNAALIQVLSIEIKNMKLFSLIASALTTEASVIGLGGGIDCDLDSLLAVTCSAQAGFKVRVQTLFLENNNCFRSHLPLNFPQPVPPC